MWRAWALRRQSNKKIKTIIAKRNYISYLPAQKSGAVHAPVGRRIASNVAHGGKTKRPQ